MRAHVHSTAMRAGYILAERFEIRTPAGSGGMGEVYRALDRETGRQVAVKLMRAQSEGEQARFFREAQVLAELEHPHIVQYVAHGVADTGDPWLAMEWIDGEPLSVRLSRGALSIVEGILLAIQIAEALGCAHARGIVHRDLKPSNVLLLDGRMDRAKLIDFGIARLRAATPMTLSGARLGTPGYMAPEQVNGEETLSARADVFSLGCVLYECLTGVPVFSGQHIMAILAKILFAQPPRLREKVLGAPVKLDLLVNRMLAKDPAERLADGQTVAAALRALGEPPAEETVTVPPESQPESLTGSEQRTVAVILIGAPRDRLHEAATVPASREMELRFEAEQHGGRFELMIDGSAVVMLASSHLATDLAAQTARCALILRDRAPKYPMALALGRGDPTTGRASMGPAIDRAAKLAGGAQKAGDGAILLDDVVAALLDARFDVREAEAGFVLLGERELADGTRTLLGKATPCVGRERELRHLEEYLEDCVTQSVAQAVLVTAQAGVGKSRLAQEFLRAVRGREEPVAVWIGRGDSLRAGSALGLLGQALRGVCGVHDGEPLDVRQEKVRACVAERIADEKERRRVTEFLGEIVGTCFPDADSVPLHAARQDAQLMNDQMRAAFTDFLAAACDKAPVLMVLEDLHWGDRPTVQFINVALKGNREKPFMVLALARPEVHELFPKLWAGRSVRQICLGELNRKAIERLVRHAMGEKATAETVERFTRLSEGNAFYLEELIRWASEGKGGELPETVVAMVQSRLGVLDDESRRLLRAASIFGEVCWAGAVATLVGGAERASQVLGSLAALVEQELLVKRKEVRFPGEDEYAFRHALLREGAYSMLTEENRKLGHRLAAEWLEARGEQDALMLAEHFEKGGHGAKAADHYLRAAEAAMRSGDSDMAVRRAKRGLDVGALGKTRMTLLGIICESNVWNLDDPARSVALAEELLGTAPPGSLPWVQASSMKLVGSVFLGKIGELRSTLDSILRTTPSPETQGVTILTICAGAYLLDLLGMLADGNAAMEAASRLLRGMGEHEKLPRAWLDFFSSARDPYTLENPWLALEHARTVGRLAESIGYGRLRKIASIREGAALGLLGALSTAEQLLRSITIADQEASYGSSVRPVFFTWFLADLGVLSEARDCAARLVAAGQSRSLLLDEARGHWVLAEVLRRMGELEAADAEVQAALAMLRKVAPIDVSGALATLSALRLAQSRPDEALTAAEEGLVLYQSIGACTIFMRGAFLRLTHARCLDALGRHDDAREAIATARQRVLANADKIEEPAYRRSFLENVPENKTTLELAREWIGPP